MPSRSLLARWGQSVGQEPTIWPVTLGIVTWLRCQNHIWFSCEATTSKSIQFTTEIILIKKCKQWFKITLIKEKAHLIMKKVHFTTASYISFRRSFSINWLQKPLERNHLVDVGWFLPLKLMAFNITLQPIMPDWPFVGLYVSGPSYIIPNWCPVVCRAHARNKENGVSTGPARPLSELGDRLGRKPLRGAKMQLRKRKAPKNEKSTIHPSVLLATEVGRGRQKQALPRAPTWLGPVLRQQKERFKIKVLLQWFQRSRGAIG